MSSPSGAVGSADPEPSSSPSPELLEVPAGGTAFRWLAASLLGGAGFLLNLLPVQLSPGIDMLLGGVFALLAAVAFGPAKGLLAGGLAGARSLALWGHGWGWLIFTLEAGFVGLLAARRKVRPMVADMLYWVVAGAPVLYLASWVALDYDATTFGVIVLKQVLNGLFNAVLVELLLLIPFVRWALRIPRFPGLQSVIAVITATAAIVPALVFGIWIGRREWSRNLSAAEQRVLTYTQAYASKLEQYVLLHEHALRSGVLASERSGSFDSAQLQRIVGVVREQFPGFVGVHATDASGRIVAIDPGGVIPVARERPVVVADTAQGPLAGDLRRTLSPEIMRSPSGSLIPVVLVSYPVIQADTVAGHLVGALDLRTLPESNPRPWEYERLVVADGQRSVIYDSHTATGAYPSTFSEVDSVVFASVTSRPLPATAYFTRDSQRQSELGAGGHPEFLAGVAAIPGLGWWVWMEEPFTRIQSFVAESYLRLFSLLIAVSVLALLASNALGRYLAAPLLRMRSAAGALAAGDLVARVGRLPVSTPVEIRELGSAFDEMAAALTGRHEELEELGDIARSLASTLDLQTLLPRITEAAERLVDADGVAISLVSGAGTRLRLADYTLGLLASSAGQEITMESSVAGWVIRNRRSLLIRETWHDTRASSADVDPETMRSVVCAPLLGRSGALGALTAVSARTSTTKVFGKADLELLERLAGNAAVAVENARLLEAAEAASRAKSAFIATMSHEVRTPLNGLLGNLELLELGIYGELAPRQRETIARMQKATQQLRTLIEDVLSFSRLEAGRFEVQLADSDLWHVVEEVAAIIRPLAREKGLDFVMENEVPEEERRVVNTDPDKVRQILSYLAGNAVKFTREGRVSITLSQDAKEVSIRVSDTGMGIAREDQSRLFLPFEQLDTGLSRAHGGAGLGLYLAGRYAELLGGRILVRSEPGVGSDFTLVLPLQQVRARQNLWMPSPGIASPRQDASHPQ
ncbi:MAG TPA: ATP-binding protein [Longimicrobiaceae bacterium]